MGLNDSNGLPIADDDDLTNLTWLQDENLLRNMSVPSDVAGNIVRILKEDNENVSPSGVCSSKDVTNDAVTQNVPCSVPPVPYNPQIHIHAKPPYSFSSLIFMAIESSANKALPVKDIYSWIVEHFPYYLTAPSGWKNTVRHNLSLNKCFRKVEKAKDDLSPLGGKGSLWCIDPELRPNLLQAVRRTPAHIYPYMSTAKANLMNMNIVQLSNTSNKNQTPRKSSSEQLAQQTLFPLLTKRLLIPVAKLSRGKPAISPAHVPLNLNLATESEEADAAASMLTLTQYNSSATDVLIIEGKSDEDAQPESGSIRSSFAVNPTGDHNYFIKSSTQGKSAQNANQMEYDNDGDEVDEVLSNKINLKLESHSPLSEDESDDDGLKGAEALLKLASRNTNALSPDRSSLPKRIRVSCD